MLKDVIRKKKTIHKIKWTEQNETKFQPRYFSFILFSPFYFKNSFFCFFSFN